MLTLQERLVESIQHSVIIMIAWLSLAYFIIVHISTLQWRIACSIVSLIFLVIFIKNPYSKKHLIVNSWISLICVLCLGNLIGRWIGVSSLFGIGIGISVADILSFTKYGTKTMNARVMSNKTMTTKLIVYGKSFKNSNPVPTKGLGDFLFYTLLLAGIYQFTHNQNFVLYGGGLIFIGCVINWIIICFIYEKAWYKGFPATFIPFICFSLLFLNF